jgi:membrane associated rhomboid family serine protease
MNTGHEVDAPVTDDPTPLPMSVDEIGGGAPAAPPPEPQPVPLTSPDAQAPSGPSLPTVESVLRAIAAANGPWFPSRYAAEAGVPRDSLDEPLAELRLAGLVRVAEWVRGVGQGYELTAEGKAAAADPARERLQRAVRAASTEVRPVRGEPVEPERASSAEPAGAPREEELAFNPPVVVPALLIANALWFFVCAVVSIRWGLTPSRALSEGHPEVLHRFGAVTGADLIQGEWWRLLSACFVHIGALHLIGNLFALAMMGPLAELLWGRGRLLIIYFVSGLAGSALAMALRPDTILAGASGAIWGVQMSLFAWLFAFRRHLPPDLAGDWFRRLCVVFALNAGVSFLPGVSWAGHLGGGLAGLLVAGLLNAARFGDARRRASAWVLLALVPVLSVAGLVAAMDAKGIPGWQHIHERLASERDASERAEQKRQLREAREAYLTQVVARAEKLAPDAVQPLESEIGILLALKKRPPQRAAAARARALELKGTAEALLRSSAAAPTGAAALDRDLARARAFAAARVRSFDLLLAMLDTPTPPSTEAWNTWQTSHREVERLWSDLQTK